MKKALKLVLGECSVLLKYVGAVVLVWFIFAIALRGIQFIFTGG